MLSDYDLIPRNYVVCRDSHGNGTKKKIFSKLLSKRNCCNTRRKGFPAREIYSLHLQTQIPDPTPLYCNKSIKPSSYEISTCVFLRHYRQP